MTAKILQFNIRVKQSVEVYRGYTLTTTYDPVRKAWRVRFAAQAGKITVPFEQVAVLKATAVRKAKRMIDRLEDGE